MARGGISGRVLVRIARFVAARGHDADRLCRRAGLTLEALSDPELRVPWSLAETFAELAAEVTADSNIGLHLAADVGDTRTFDAGVLLLMASPTVRVALERMAKNQRYWSDVDRCSLVPVSGGMKVRYAMPEDEHGHAGDQRHNDECALAEIVLGLRQLAGTDVVPRAVRFRHAEPADRREHDALFRCPIAFGQLHSEVELDDAALELPMRDANEAFANVFQAQVDQAIARLPRSETLTPDVKAAARAAIGAGECSLEQTARVLGTSPRTLQRKLEAEGTSWSALVDSLRHEMALAYLAQGLPLPAVAQALGYADVTAFHRAFKRWTGSSPGQLRVPR